MSVRFRWGRACSCMVKVLPLVEQEMLLRGLISDQIDYFQLAYNTTVSASARTHAGGGVFDTAQFSDAHLKVWREWGCEVQHRTPAQGFDPHGHGVIKGCPHVSKGRSGAEWQLTEWEAGRNGLRGQGPITGPGPIGRDTPTWKQAVKERTPIIMSLKSDIVNEVLAGMKKPPSSATIAKAVWNYGIASPGKSRELWTASHLTDWLARVSGGSSAKVDALANLVTVQSAQIAEQGRQITALTALVKGQTK